ncbi:CIA30 family protein [Algibacter lectus]|uniref:CIA30 family protein n=1 Tax=Algibacter lectus TaxID=221126 RepID=UPI002494D3F8|nr:CIA30 family protein [Algibacter lectus]
MKPLILILLIATTMQIDTIFKFENTSDITNWTVVNDAVMGGKSSGAFTLNETGHGVYTGHVSLENNGGFSSLRYRFNDISTEGFSKVILKIKGDGKNYQFRVKSKLSDKHSYIALFSTSKTWEVIEISLADMYPAFRGRKLDIPNFDANSIEEVAFLIGNKTAEDFKLEIDSIVLK